MTSKLLRPHSVWIYLSSLLCTYITFWCSLHPNFFLSLSRIEYNKGYITMPADFDLEINVLATIWFVLMVFMCVIVCIFWARNNSIEKRRTPTYATTANIVKTNKLLLITPLIENSLKLDVETQMNRPKPYKPSFSWS